MIELNFVFSQIVCQQVFSNGLILNKIFRCLPLRELFHCLLVCSQWRREAKRVIDGRHQFLHVLHLFRYVNVSYDEDKTGVCFDGQYPYDWFDFESAISRAVVRHLYSVPKLIILLYGSFGDDVKLEERLSHVNVCRKCLPSNCLMLNLNSAGIMGSPTTSSIPIEKISHFGNLAAASLILLPDYPGVDINVFNAVDMNDKLANAEHLKCILLFSTTSIFQDNGNLYGDLTRISRLVSSRDHRLALAGYNSAYFNFNKSDFINFVLPTISTTEMQTRELLGIAFMGECVKACSLVLQAKRQAKVESKLREFKKRLDFDPVNDSDSETIAFMFTDEERNTAYIKSNLFYKIFPGVKLIGVFAYGQYGHDFWPSIDTKTPKVIKNSHGVNIRVKKFRRLTLHSNAATLVIINLPKRIKRRVYS